jgi:hypothetical protein
VRPYFSRQPSHAWCHHFAERCEADSTFARWRHGAAYCSADDIAAVHRAFFEHTHETNAWFRRYLARMAAERPRHAQRLLQGEGARDGESHARDAHPYPAI